MAQLERRQVSVWCAGATRCRGRVLRVAEGPSLAARPVAQAPPRWRFRPNQRPEAAGPARRAPRGARQARPRSEPAPRGRRAGSHLSAARRSKPCRARLQRRREWNVPGTRRPGGRARWLAPAPTDGLRPCVPGRVPAPGPEGGRARHVRGPGARGAGRLRGRFWRRAAAAPRGSQAEDRPPFPRANWGRARPDAARAPRSQGLLCPASPAPVRDPVV